MKNIIFYFPLLFVIVLYAQDDSYQKVKYPPTYQGQLNITYTQIDDWNGTFDLYRPQNTKNPTPLIIDIHGGGWIHGVKESHWEFEPFFNMNWAVANIEYRVAGQAPAPSAIEDVRCALIYLIKNSRELNINPNKIVLMGNSAGGHLALMAGLLGNDHIFDKNCPDFDSIQIFAIIDKYGPVDLRNPKKLGTKSVLTWVKEKVINPKFMNSISPITYVTKNSPPVFIVHGDADPTVPYSQSVALNQELENFGVVHQFFTVKDGGHGQFSPEDTKKIDDSIIEFLTGLGLNKPQ